MDTETLLLIEDSEEEVRFDEITSFLCAMETTAGRVREVNQDAAFVDTVHIEEHIVATAVVCDGVGGLVSSELASKYVVEKIAEWFKSEFPNMVKQQFHDEIMASLYRTMDQFILTVNEELVDKSSKMGIQSGTTLTWVILVDDEYLVAQIGDSRAYHFGTVNKQVTEDQSLVAKEVRAGIITEEQARVDKRRNIILQCLGVHSKVNPVISRGKIQAGDTLLLCSDGFVHEQTFDDMKKLINVGRSDSESHLHELISTRIQNVMDLGERDNITAVLVKAV